ncbi:anhydro-N-acetylmuramic acid kinase [Polluticoccus soli]|uniref:anhydro-N-acetylmuramic acid kinase n=1 Tax=Polluticoccus soli TaxID=3034150 RepID=UPI0023E23183|nr:anhydro-N-acetylmuramic acid kinase [Flavipsychrobacter sp. JY13-12]
MVYNVIGLMSGSSLDGLDICYTSLEETRGQWKFDILEAETIPYSKEWTSELHRAPQLGMADFLKLNTRYGRFIGEKVNAFIKKYGIDHKVHFIASHGHTVFHEPANATTCQIGDGATIAAVTGLPVISDLRSLDVALGGQGAPIVPIGDKLLFGNFDYWLNIGGIANMTVRNGENLMAFDVCPANQVLNELAAREGKDMDFEGYMAKEGTVLADVLSQLNSQEYYKKPAPKSLSNEMAKQLVFPSLLLTEHNTKDLLRTAVEHIAHQIADAVKNYPHAKEEASMLVTGGGAFNNFLVEQLREELKPYKVNPVVPYEQVVKFKEALVMALIGALRWREETNVLSSVTGASKDSVGGALWMGHSYSGD